MFRNGKIDMSESCATAATPQRNRIDTIEANRPIHDARALVGSDGKAVIRLGETEYTLRITRQNKLILTK